MNATRKLVITLMVCALMIPVVSLCFTTAAGAEVRIGDVYVGDGCARVGDLVAGDCEGQAGEASETSLPNETTSASSENTSTDTPDAGNNPICPARPTGDVRRATVSRAVDGDTLELSEEVSGTDRVRMIGADAPEMEDGASKDPEPGAEAATRFTAENLEGEEILLETDEDTKDDYGRLLAYVWLPPADESPSNEDTIPDSTADVEMDSPEQRYRLFNSELLEGGYAGTMTIPPNDLYAECFESIEPDTEGNASNTQYDNSTEEVTVLENSEATTAEDQVTRQYVEQTEYEAPPEETYVTEQTTVIEETYVPHQAPPLEETTTFEPENIPVNDYTTPSFEETEPLETVTETYPSADLPSESGTLPTVETPSGTVAILPDTGGLSVFRLLMLSAGLLLSAAGIWGVHHSLSRWSNRR